VTTLRTFAFLTATVLGAALLVACEDPRAISGAVAGSRVTVATSMSSTGSDQATLDFEITGNRTDATYTLTLHAGSCDQPGASGGRLGTIALNQTGRGMLRTTMVNAGATGEGVALTPALLGDGDHVVIVRDEAGATAACVALPKAS